MTARASAQWQREGGNAGRQLEGVIYKLGIWVGKEQKSLG